MGIQLQGSTASAALQAADVLVKERIEAALDAAGIPVVASAADAGCLVVHLTLDKEADRVEELHASLGSTPLVVVTPSASARSVRKAVQGGTDGLLWEDDVDDRLAATVLAVNAGQIAVPRELWRRIAPPELTNREKQVLGLVIMGMSNGEIAEKLYLTESTVKSHLSSGFRKLGVASRAEAARVITDPRGGLGTGILAITTSSSGPATS